jgi:nucleoside-diphosphate-sugar epimerase
VKPKLSDKILIAGAAGFIGSHLAELCGEQAYDVITLDRKNPNNHWCWLEDSKYKNDIKDTLGNMRDYGLVFKKLEDYKPAFRLMALIGISYSYVIPLAYY